MRVSILVICFLTVLAGCKTTEEKAAEAAADEIRQCSELGLKPKSEAFATCRLAVRQLKEQEEANRVSKYMAWQGMNANVQNSMQRKRTTSTNCQKVGTSIQCSHY